MHCEVAQRVAGRLDCAPGVRHALGFVFERWDGKGFPGDTRGEALPLAARVLHVCRDVCVFEAAAGQEAAVDVIRRRAGSAYDPDLAAVLCRDAAALLGGLGEASVEAALAAEPGRHATLDGDRLDDALAAIGDFADLKAPCFVGHARCVAELAEAAAWRLRLGADDARLVGQAALLADLGRVGVSSAVWDKPGPLAYAEWERVRLHPYYTERALSPVAALFPVSTVAAAHHERLDGSGYHRRVPAVLLDAPARVLAAADAYQAMREPRPHRPALDEEAAAGELRRQIRGGRLDGDAAAAVLQAAGVAAERRPPVRLAGLTEREVEVLQLLARGRTNREIAEALHVSPKTVGHHVQHVYGKAGVRSRAAATLFAVEHGLLRP